MAVADLVALEVTLNYIDADATALAAIVNDGPNNINPGQANGTVTTRQGTVVKNVQKVLIDLETVDSVKLHANAAIANKSIATGFNAESVGPFSINTGVIIDIAIGSRWIIL